MKQPPWEYSPNGEIPADRDLPEGVFRFAMKVEYDGAGYSGWQRQDHSKSVQETLDRVISKVADAEVSTICAGRTDSGVHATSQFVHFDTRSVRTERNWKLGVNSGLPDDISVSWVKRMPAHFHARFSAQSRTYRYLIFNQGYKPAILNRGLTWCRHTLDVERMNEAACYLMGEHDFSSFRAAGCGAHSPIREVQSVRLEKCGDIITLEIRANAFLQHMVRNIVGLLIEIGQSKHQPQYLKQILELKDRSQSAPTARPNGLYLVDVEYPAEFSIPKEDLGPSFMRWLQGTNGN